MQLRHLRRFRCFLLLGLIDVEAATGIAAERVSKAERGLTTLNAAEKCALERFYQARFRMVVAGDEEPANQLLLGE